MKDGPDISKTAAMMGDPARANMLMALMSGMSLTANELAREAGVTPSTASGHLSQLEASGLVTSRKQGRYRYFKLADADVAHAVEALVVVAARAGHLRSRPGPKNDAMRQARTCYDHLAGHAAVELFKRWVAVGILQWRGDEVCLSQTGRQGLVSTGIDVARLEGLRRPLCRTCIDWSERQHHLGGSIGAAVLSTLIEHGWACRVDGARTIHFQRNGEAAFISWYSGPSMADA
jgi:DNA-binding transcriptional ArsR family regulator